MKLLTAPIFRMYKLAINEADRKHFFQEGSNNLLTSFQNEPGTLSMFATHADPKGTVNFVFEVYKDLKNYDIHAKSPQFKHYGKVAQKVIQKHEVEELQPKYFLAKDGPLAVVGGKDIIGQLVQIKMDNSENDFVQKLKLLMNQLHETETGTLISYAATKEKSSDEWVLWNVYPNKADFDLGQTEIKDFLDKLKLTYQIQKLTIDTMINQGEIQYSEL